MGDNLEPKGASPAGESTPAQAGSDSGTWLTMVPKAIADEHREILSGFDSSESFFKRGIEAIESAQDAKQFEGRTWVPKEGEPEQNWKNFYTALGRPEDAKGYEIEDESISTLYHKANLTKAQADMLNEGFVEFSGKTQKEFVERTNAEKEATYKTAMGKLSDKYGKELDAKMKSANTAIVNLGGNDLVSLLQKKGIDNDPEMIGFFVNLGELMNEGAIPAGHHLAPKSEGFVGHYDSMKGI